MNRNYSFDGEKIKEVQTEVVRKHSPKQIIESLDDVRGKIGQMEQQAMQLIQQQKTNENNIRSAKAFEKDLAELEDKCMNIQYTHIIERIAFVKDEYKAKAQKSAEIGRASCRERV